MTVRQPADAPSDGRAVAGSGRPLLDTLYQRLTDPAVRDLAWLLFSADLLRAQPLAPLAEPWTGADEARAAAAWLTQLDRDPARLHAALDATRLTRLGRYAETLLGWFLAQGPGPRLVAANVALRRAGLTLGECDFLVETSDARRLHWELAVKWYMHSGVAEGGVPGLADFVGPNLRDRFDLKRAHLLDHQLRLSAREEFAWLGYQGPWLAQMFWKGWLFYRAGKGAGTPPGEPPELAEQHGRGWWVTHADWAGFAERERADGWSVLPRLAWLAPRRIGPMDSVDPDEGKRLPAPQETGRHHDAGDATLAARRAVAAPVPAATLFAGLAQVREPVMVAAFVADGAGGYVERSRGFIVPADWPARARAFARP
ncbi:MAG: DUF1853 family protein [Paraburkholderia sp.]|jgi:hypothetical protein|nr:DUF1853 family protein [Paraburkholderia sp.]